MTPLEEAIVFSLLGSSIMCLAIALINAYIQTHGCTSCDMKSSEPMAQFDSQNREVELGRLPARLHGQSNEVREQI